MKKLLLAALMITGLISCKKEEAKPTTTVGYEVSCTGCTVSYTNEYGFGKTVNVNGTWKTDLANFYGDKAQIEVTEAKPSSITTSIFLNYYEVLRKTGPGKFEYKVK